MTFPRVSRRGRHFANVGDVIIYPDLVVDRTGENSVLIRVTTPSLRLSENWVVGDASRSGRTKPITKRGNVHCDWFILPLLFPTPKIWFSLDHKRNVSDGVGRKLKRFDSSDSDYVALIIFLIFTIGHKRSYDSAYASDSYSL